MRFVLFFLVSANLFGASFSPVDNFLSDLTDQARFPIRPNAELTPGTLCQSGNLRYPERISYCERSVKPTLKREIMVVYDQRLGFEVTEMKRDLFKIDHYIPLCAGGGNHPENLWPQHTSIYTVTDPLEDQICKAMADGRLSQARALELIKKGKNDLREVPILLRSLTGDI